MGIPAVALFASLRIVAPADGCPSAALVAERLRAVGHGAGDGVVTIGREGGELVLALALAGAPPATRRVAAEGSCAALATAAAIVIEARRGELAAESALPEIAATSVPAPRPATRWTAEALGGASFAGGAAGAGTLGVSVHPFAFGPLGLRAAVFGASRRTLDLEPPGRVRWTRLGAAVGPTLVARRGAASAGMRADLVGALVSAEGEGLATTARNTGFAPGVGAGVRFGLDLGARLSVLVDGELRRWLFRHRALVGGGAPHPLPQHDVQLLAGLAWRFFP